MTRLRDNKLGVVDMSNVTKSKTPRVNVNVADLTQVGRTAKDRAILEGERRFCGNKTDDISGDAVIMNKMERVAMLLDLRTAGGAHVDKDTYVKAKEELKETYIEYGLQCDKFDAQTEKDAEPKEPSVASKVITSSRTKPPTWTQGFILLLDVLTIVMRKMTELSMTMMLMMVSRQGG